MKKDESLSQKFERELKSRVLLKTSPSTLPEKVLVEGFKHFDLNGSGKVSRAGFVKVMKVRVGITTLTDAEIEAAFDLFAAGAAEMPYKEFVNSIFESQVGHSITDRMKSKQGVEMPQNRFDVSKHEESIRKNIEYIIYKLRGGSIGSFFALYFDLWSNQNSEGEVSASHFHQALKKHGIEFSGDDIQRIFYFVAHERSMMRLEDLFDFLLGNYSEERQRLVAGAFARFDYMQSQKVSLQLVKELFNARVFPGVREGRFTWEELTVQWEKLTNAYSKFNKNSFVIDQHDFLQFFGFLSGFIKEEQDFAQFIDACFRYAELPRGNAPKDSSLRGDARSNVIEQLSVKNSRVEDLAAALVQQLNGKGDRAFIFFYKLLKCKDFDGDGRVFENEFEKSIAESRLSFSRAQTQRLFEEFAVGKKALVVVDFVNLLVPRFSDEKAGLVVELFQRLVFSQSGSGSLTYDQIVAALHLKQHPDFKKGIRADYEIKAEFEDCLKTFLSLHLGSHLVVSQDALLRFFEFYGRNWDFGYLDAVTNNAFKVKSVATKSEFTRPYGTTSEVEQQTSSLGGRQGTSPRMPPGGPVSSGTSSLLDEYNRRSEAKRQAYQPSNMLSHDESPSKAESAYKPDLRSNILAHDESAFVKKPVDYKVSYPYHVTDDKSVRPGMEARSTGRSRRPPQDNRIVEPLPVQTFETNSQESKKNKSPRSEFNPHKRELLDQSQKNVVNSPEDGSVLPADEHFRYTAELNEKLESTSVRQAAPKVNNDVALRKRMIDVIRQRGKYELFLDLELELTESSDSKGFIDFEVFASTLEKYELTKGLKHPELSAIYVSFLFGGEKVHVQRFVNTMRGQMTKYQEETTIGLYDRITPADQELPRAAFKAAFLAHKFRFSGYKTTAEAKDLIGKMSDVFYTLNLEVRGKDTFDLDEFLYFFDNFAFFLSSNEEYGKFVETCFK